MFNFPSKIFNKSSSLIDIVQSGLTSLNEIIRVNGLLIYKKEKKNIITPIV